MIPDMPASKSSSQVDGVLAEIMEQIASQVRRGEEVHLEQYEDRWPEHAGEIRDLYPTIVGMVQMAQELRDEQSRRSLDEASDLISRPHQRRLGDFRILREVGRGGMGVVYEAEQISLGRRVALKVLPFAVMLDERLLRRFQNEARAAATLEHSHIVAVYSIGSERGIHYFSMQYVEGQTIAEVIELFRGAAGSGPSTCAVPRPATTASPDEGGRLMPEETSLDDESYWQPGDPWETGGVKTRAASQSDTLRAGTNATGVLGSGKAHYRRMAELAHQVAEALYHAHTQGVVHRDIKPSNLMLDEQGRLWVTDFGLAMTPADANLTLTGDVVGTLRYSSPEQARGGTVVDHRTDVYSLGVTLYEMLALQPAFDAGDRQQLLHEILHDDPRPLQRLRRDLPADLGVIVHKAIAKDPAERYQTAQALADDLQRFLDHKPIAAKPPGLAEAGLKWARRRPATAALVAVCLAAALVILLGLGIYTVQLRSAYYQLAVLQNENLESDSRLHRDVHYPANIAVAAAAIDQRDFATARRALDSCLPPRDGIEDPRGLEWHFLANRVGSPRLVRSYSSAGNPILSVAISPDQRHAAIGDKLGNVRVFDWETGNEVRTFHPFQGETRVAFSPRGTWLAAGSDFQDGRIVLWNTGDWNQVADFRAHEGTIYCIEFTEDEKTLATGGRDEIVKLWTIERVLAAQAAEPTSLAMPDLQFPLGSVAYKLRFSPEGAALLSVEEHNRLRVWNARDGALQKTICETPEGESLQSAILLAAGKYCVAAGYQDKVRFFDLNSRQETGQFNCGDSVFDLAASRDGRVVAAACDDGSVTLWKISDPALASVERVTFGAHRGHIHRLAMTPDGRYLLTASDDGQANLWDLGHLPTPDLRFWNLRTPAGTGNLAFSPDEKLLAVTGADGVIRILEARSGTLQRELRVPDRHLRRLAISPDGAHLIAFSDQQLFVWKSKDWQLLPAMDVPGDKIMDVALAGKQVLVSHRLPESQGRLTVFEVESGKAVRVIDLGKSIPYVAASSSDGSQIAVGTDDAQVLLLDPDSFKARSVKLPFPGVARLAFSRSGKALVAIGNEDTFCDIDTRTAKLGTYHRAQGADFSGVCLSADERLAALADQRQKCIHIWDLHSSRMLFTVDPLHFQPFDLALSPSGRYLAATTKDADPQGNSGIVIWDLIPEKR